MSDPVTIALITATATAAPLILTQIVGFIISMRRTEKVAGNVKEALEVTEKKTEEKLDHIVVLTNSTLTAANKKIADLTSQVERLERLLEEKDRQ